LYFNLNRLFEKYPESEPALVNKLSKHLHHKNVYLGNSLPIREWDLAICQKTIPAKVFANRGANGIDGQVSTFLGWASSGVENWAILGDLTALYDLSSLWITRQLEVDNLTILVINNGGGMIFNKIFESEYFLNRHEINFSSWAKMWNWHYEKWQTIPSKPISSGFRIIEMVPVEEHTKQDLLRHFNIDPTNIQTLPLTHPDLVPNTESLPSELEGTRYFLALGANDPRKNIACITTAFQELKKDPAFADVKCVLIGGRPIPRLYDSTTLFIHISRPSDALLATLMQKAAALLYPSWYEGFGLPLHEVHKYGTPVVASTSGALPETAPPGTLFVPPFKPHLWTHAMHSVLQYPKKHSIEHPPSTRDSGESAKTIINTLRRIAQTS
jgi:glycosyltransferase involved in cell wall biosynthesis